MSFIHLLFKIKREQIITLILQFQTKGTITLEHYKETEFSDFYDKQLFV